MNHRQGTRSVNLFYKNICILRSFKIKKVKFENFEKRGTRVAALPISRAYVQLAS